MHTCVGKTSFLRKYDQPTSAIFGPPGGHFEFLRFSKKEWSNQKTFSQKLFRGSNNIGFELFPDQVGHFELSRRWWCCRLCGLVGGERVPLSPLGWYCVYLYPIPFNQYPCKLIAFSFCNANSKSNRETSYLAYRYKGMYFRDLKVCKMYVFMKKIGM